MNPLHAFRYPKTVITAITLITGFFAWHLPGLVINNDVVIFLPENNPHREAFIALNEEFGRNDGIIIAATAKNGTIVDSANIDALMRMTDALEQIDSVDQVMSLVNSDYVEGVEGGIETSPIVEQAPRDSADKTRIRRRLQTWDIYENTLYTGDFTTSMVLVAPCEHSSIERDEAIFFAVQDSIDSYRSVFDFQVAGFPSVFVLVGRNMTHDLAWLIPFVVVVVILTLWYSFRTAGGVLLPLLTVAISTIWSLGLMSLLGIEMTLIATVVPVLLVAVGSAYGIHIMAHYYEEYRAAHTPPATPISDARHERILGRAIAGVGRPVLMAALTTIIGFGSLASSHIVPVRDFGIFTSIGVLAAFVVAISLIPSLLHFVHARHGYRRSTENNPVIQVLLTRIERVSHYPRTVAVVSFTLALLAALGAARIRIGSAVIDFFQRDSSVWQANDWLQRNTNGTVTLSVIVRDDGESSLTHPDMLKALDDFAATMRQRFTHVRKVGSMADLVKRMNEVMHVEERRADSTAEYYEIPYEPEKYGFDERDQLQQLIVQYMMLFSGDIDAFADDPISPTRLRVMLQMNTNDVDSLRRIQTAVREWFDEHIPDRYPVEIAGTADAEIAVNRLIVHSQISSILISLVAVFAVLAVYYRALLAGALGMLCLAIPLLLNFGAMGLLGIHLDIATAMISSIAIGIGIDYVIHFMDGYARELAKSGGGWEGVATRTIMSRGRAIVFNAVSVALGFAVILFSTFKPLNHLGGLIFFTMLTSALVSLTLLPVMLNRLRPRFVLKYHFLSAKGGQT